MIRKGNLVKSISARQALILLIPIVLGSILLLYATATYGVGVSRDSVGYLNAARNLAVHGSFATDVSPGPRQPLTIWPILYPALLAPLYLVDAQVLQSVRFLNIALFGLYIAAIQILVLRETRGSVFVAFGAGLFAALSYSVLHIYSRAWSETPFLVLFLFGMLFLGRHLLRPRWIMLAMAGSFFALAWLTRYIGVALLVTGSFALLSMSEQRFRRRVLDCAFFVIIAAVPMLILLLRNRIVSGSTVSRVLVVHPVDSEWWNQALGAMAAWLIPADSQPALGAISIAFLILL